MSTPEEIGKRYAVLSAHLDERQRRLWAAAEAQTYGYGGVSAVAGATGMSRVTIAQGVHELEEEASLPVGRVRRLGGGCKPLTETDPTLREDLGRLGGSHHTGRPRVSSVVDGEERAQAGL